MAYIQNYGIKYPFTANNEDNLFLDLNKTIEEDIKSKILHIILTPKGQKLRNPDFGTDLIRYIFENKIPSTIDSIKNEIKQQISKSIPNVEFEDISVYNDETDPNAKILTIHYSIMKGNTKIKESTGIRL